MLKNLSIKEFSQLLRYLYDGYLEENPYGHFLDYMRELLDLNFASITLREPIGNDGGLLFISNDSLTKTLIDAHDNPYTDQYYTSDLMTNLPWGKVVTIDEIIPYGSFENSDLYRMCMEPIGIYHMAGVDLRLANGQRFTVRLCRPKEAPNFTAEERDFIAEVAPHIQRAVANGIQLIQLDTEHKLFAKTISGLSIGTITLDKHGKVIHCNMAAQELLREDDGISIVDGDIKLSRKSSKDKLNDYIATAIGAQKSQDPVPVNALAIERPSGKANLEVLVKPIAVDESIESKDTPRAMLFISDPEKKYEIDIKILMSLYQLTHAEARLAKHLAAGRTLDESANELGIARNTARAQLRSIFAKTGVTQQSILVSLILKSLATFS